MGICNTYLIFFIFCGISINHVCSKLTAQQQLEWDLREWLFSDNYEVQTRPDTLVMVTTSFHLLTLNYLDIKDQKLSVTGYFHFAWADGRLEWYGNATFFSLRFIFRTEKDIWTPPVIVENAVDGLDVISRPNIPIRILRHGMVAWLPAGIFTTSCESSLTYWPLDTQTCDVILSSWGYTDTEVTLRFDTSLENAIVTSFYQEHGEWELIDKSYSSSIIQRNKETFSRLTFTLKLRRRPLFHVLNTLFPVVLMGFLTAVIFKLTPESGERVGLALTILLAYAVYLGLISEYIPQTSLSASLLSTYLASILLLQTIAVFLTVIYLDIYLTPEARPVPQWLQSITSSCLSKLVCIKCCKKEGKVEPCTMEHADKDSERALPVKANWDVMEEEICQVSEENVITNYIQRIDCGLQKQYSWKEIALFLDRVTMYIYLILVTLMTLTFTLVMAQHYITS